jgi:hypothetical protein
MVCPQYVAFTQLQAGSALTIEFVADGVRSLGRHRWALERVAGSAALSFGECMCSPAIADRPAPIERENASG